MLKRNPLSNIGSIGRGYHHEDLQVWLPNATTSGGGDVFYELLADALAEAGVRCVLTTYPAFWQYVPWRLACHESPPGTTAIIANTHIAFAFAGRGIPVIGVEHHCVFDPSYSPYRTAVQALYHELLVRRFEAASLRSSSAIVAVSNYTARSLHDALGGPWARVITNGIETDYFCPGPHPKSPLEGRPVRLLFVGNLTRRKGADLLPRIMAALGPGYELRYTSGLRATDAFPGSVGMVPLGHLTREQLRNEYRQADLLLFPTRFEGFGYAVAEAMACGTPVVTTRCSALPELVDDGETGRLCRLDDVADFVRTVRELTANTELLQSLGRTARLAALQKFRLRQMAGRYSELLVELGNRQIGETLAAAKSHAFGDKVLKHEQRDS